MLTWRTPHAGQPQSALQPPSAGHRRPRAGRSPHPCLRRLAASSVAVRALLRFGAQQPPTACQASSARWPLLALARSTAASGLIGSARATTERVRWHCSGKRTGRGTRSPPPDPAEMRPRSAQAQQPTRDTIPDPRRDTRPRGRARVYCVRVLELPRERADGFRAQVRCAFYHGESTPTEQCASLGAYSRRLPVNVTVVRNRSAHRHPSFLNLSLASHVARCAP